MADVVALLERSRSCHVAPFLALRGLLQAEAQQAIDTLQYMSTLEEPSRKLAAAAPRVNPSLHTTGGDLHHLRGPAGSRSVTVGVGFV